MDSKFGIFTDEPHSKLFDKLSLEKFVTDGNKCVEFKLIRTVEDLEDATKAFHPEMCHQIFGDGETIFGYENLKIKLYFAAGSLEPFVGIKYTSEIEKSLLGDDGEVDNVIELLGSVLQPGYCSNLDVFSAVIEKNAVGFKPMGELVHSFEKQFLSKPEVHQNGNLNWSSIVQNGNFHGAELRTFEVYYCDASVPKFLNYHKRMETFIKWYIDAASFLDAEDDKWKFFVLFEKYKSSDGQAHYAFVGYSSVYNFYCYPENIRPRIAQMLILPPFQRQGLAVELMSAIYREYRTNKKVVEITVEDPSDDFEVLRDFVDSRDCMNLSSYSAENLRVGCTAALEKEAKEVLKMTKRQSKRICEILRLRVTNSNDEAEFTNFRLSVKKRLNIPYQRQEADIKKMISRRMNDSAKLQQASQVDDATRKTELESNFQNLLSHYKIIIQRLEKHGQPSSL